MRLILTDIKTKKSFGFESYSEYLKLVSDVNNIDNLEIECDSNNLALDEELFYAWGVTHDSVCEFYEALKLDKKDKIYLIILGEDITYFLSLKDLAYAKEDISYIEANSYEKLAELVYQDEVFPDCLSNKMDEVYKILKEDLMDEYTPIVIDGVNYFYTMK